MVRPVYYEMNVDKRQPTGKWNYSNAVTTQSAAFSFNSTVHFQSTRIEYGAPADSPNSTFKTTNGLTGTKM